MLRVSSSKQQQQFVQDSKETTLASRRLETLDRLVLGPVPLKGSRTDQGYKYATQTLWHAEDVEIG